MLIKENGIEDNYITRSACVMGERVRKERVNMTTQNETAPKRQATAGEELPTARQPSQRRRTAVPASANASPGCAPRLCRSSSKRAGQGTLAPSRRRLQCRDGFAPADATDRECFPPSGDGANLPPGSARAPRRDEPPSTGPGCTHPRDGFQQRNSTDTQPASPRGAPGPP